MKKNNFLTFAVLLIALAGMYVISVDSCDSPFIFSKTGISQKDTVSAQEFTVDIKIDSINYKVSFEKKGVIVYEVTPAGEIYFNADKQISELSEKNDTVSLLLVNGDTLKVPAKEYYTKANKAFAKYLKQPWQKHDVTITPSPVYE